MITGKDTRAVVGMGETGESGVKQSGGRTTNGHDSGWRGWKGV